MSGFIYFFQVLDPDELRQWIKIGFAKDPAARLKLIQTGSPYCVRPLLWVPGTRLQEQELHRMLKEYRLRGEWFAPKGWVLDAIKALAARFPEYENQAMRTEYARMPDSGDVVAG